MSLFHVTFAANQKAFQRTMISRLVTLEEATEENSRKLNAITIQKGVSIKLPFKLPIDSQQDIDIAANWLDIADNRDSLVSFILLFRDNLHSFKNLGFLVL